MYGVERDNYRVVCQINFWVARPAPVVVISEAWLLHPLPILALYYGVQRPHPQGRRYRSGSVSEVSAPP